MDTIIVEIKDVQVIEVVTEGPQGPTGSVSDYMPRSWPPVTKVADYTITDSDYTVILDASSNPVTGTLRTAVGIAGRIFNIKCKNDTFPCTVQGDGTETMDDENEIALIKDESLTVQSDGSNWVII